MTRLCVSLPLVLFLGTTTLADDKTPAQPTSFRSYVEMIRRDLSQGKVRMLGEVMQLKESEAEIFWPLYREYEGELFSLGDRRLALLKTFAEAHRSGSFDDDKARQITKDWFEQQSERQALLKTLHDAVAKELTPIHAVQVTQIEGRIGRYIDLALASQSPLIEGPAPAGEASESEAADPLWPYVEDQLDDLQHGKVGTIHRVMKLSDAEAETFWQIYSEYEEHAFALGDRHLKLAGRFLMAQKDGALTPAVAAKIAARWFELEAERLSLLKKAHDRISKDLSPVRAAQFGQIEHRFSVLVDLMISSQLPLVRPQVALVADG